MKKYTICCFLLISVLSGSMAQSANPLTRILQVPQDGLPLAQIFDSKVPDPSVYRAHSNKVYYIWGAASPQQPDSIVASKYFPSIRNPEKELTIEWYQQHHPDWIMYKEDRKTPAYGYIYSYGGLVPLDISNPEVREFYLDKFIHPAIRQGYKMVAMDNVDLGNWPGSAGHYSGNTWVPLYTGKKNDTVFQQNMINWMKFLSDRLHPLGVAVAANVKATTAPKNVVLQMMNAVDMWLDETGFVHTGKNVTDAAWERTFSLLKETGPEKGYASINQVSGPVAEAPKEQIEWMIANFLLSRKSLSMLAVAGFDKSAAYQQFNYRPEMDVNIGVPTEAPRKDGNAWIRRYSRGMVLVNPSSKDTATVQLPKGKWKRPGGLPVSRKLVLPPASGVILTL